MANPQYKRRPRQPRYPHRINQYIKVPELRVLNVEGEQIGVLSRDEALEKAKEAGLDLVEIAPKAKPPVARIIDYKKFLYQENKKKQKQAKAQKKSGMKEVRLTPFMADGDLAVRVKRVNEFIEDGYKVRVTVRFTGRQMSRKKQGYVLVEKLLASLGDAVKVEQEPKFVGRQLILTLTKA